MVAALAEADFFQRLRGAFVAIAQGNDWMTVAQWQFDVLLCGRASQQIKALENKAEFVIPQLSCFLAAELGHGNAIEQIGSAGRRVEAAQRVH